MSVNEGRKRVSFGFVCFQVVLAYKVIVLCKCSGKYIDIYFKLKITCFEYFSVISTANIFKI